MSLQGETRAKTRNNICDPKHYKEIIHNDDFTPMEFVVEILMDIFRKELPEAERLMMMVHKNGRASVGTYAYDIAVTKVRAAMDRAKEEGFPFRVTAEEA